MKKETIVTLRIEWEDDFYDSPTTWQWHLVEGLNDAGLSAELIPHPSGGDVVESVDIVRFDPELLVATPEMYLG